MSMMGGFLENAMNSLQALAPMPEKKNVVAPNVAEQPPVGGSRKNRKDRKADRKDRKADRKDRKEDARKASRKANAARKASRKDDARKASRKSTRKADRRH